MVDITPVDPGTSTIVLGEGSIAQLSYTVNATAPPGEIADLNPQDIDVVEYSSLIPLTVSPKPGKVQAVGIDSDNDGVCDFDERYRFKGLDPNNPDSDGDDVPDKIDIREYMFDGFGIFDHHVPDLDEDGDRKEADPQKAQRGQNGPVDHVPHLILCLFAGFFDFLF